MPTIHVHTTDRGAIIQVRAHQTPSWQDAYARAGETPPPAVLANAMIDTGARTTAIDRSLARELELIPLGYRAMGTPSTGNTPAMMPLYEMALTLEHASGPCALTRCLEVVEAPLSQNGYRILLGRDVLDHCLLIYDGPRGTATLCF